MAEKENAIFNLTLADVVNQKIAHNMQVVGLILNTTKKAYRVW